MTSIAEMSAKDTAGFLEAIASPVFRGETSQTELDLSRQKLRLVFSLQNPQPDPAQRIDWVSLTLSAPKESGDVYSFLSWDRLVTDQEDVDLGKPAFGSGWPQAPTTVLLDPQRIRIVRTRHETDSLPGIFTLDAEVDLGRGPEVYVASIFLQPDSQGEFRPAIRFHRWHLPKKWSLDATLELDYTPRATDTPKSLPVTLLRDVALDFTLWQIVQRSASDASSRDLIRTGDEKRPVYFASAQDAGRFIAVMRAKDEAKDNSVKRQYRLSWDGSREHFVEAVSARSLSQDIVESVEDGR